MEHFNLAIALEDALKIYCQKKQRLFVDDQLLTTIKDCCETIDYLGSATGYENYDILIDSSYVMIGISCPAFTIREKSYLFVELLKNCFRIDFENDSHGIDGNVLVTFVFTDLIKQKKDIM